VRYRGRSRRAVLNQLGIGGAEILPPQVSQVLRELVVIEPEAVPEGLVHVIQGDRADAAAPPDIAHALENFSIRQPEPGLPQLVHAKIRGHLQHAANVEYHRANHHDGLLSLGRYLPPQDQRAHYHDGRTHRGDSQQ